MKFGNKLFLIALIVSVVFISASSWAAPSAQIIFTLTQPDGKEFRAKTEGDEWDNWLATEDGYTIIKDKDTGYWVYARLDSKGKLTKSSLRVGIDKPVGIKKGLRPANKKQRPGLLPQPNKLKRH